MSQTIYLFRHGETEFNLQGRYQGELDSPLTEAGIQQVQQNARMLKSIIGNPQDWKIVSSPLGRAMQSAEIICETIGYDVQNVQQDKRLAELAVGQMGRTNNV
ncbi:histidine phosphatase family protein [Lysinibacillus pakistanensis]|uniref:Phosphoglycerate mutase family protein n=1 Tax=Lysinibacillus pakistanensis TaxID=759811 RepID=A0AAX3WS04_9BACI|nr:phosphoglycerate mutase family protein [Lysinibacillus pakistanensis]MDM5233901.1 phosphoglycerate mutase family protein [Lysinibacillus pakistanensis]WHY44511.1 phosphoglycerate mutase family protein [Lysinibacillus pakistanensis]WHY49519.1 phosphoglycerate mutase family protein [Lysinibacillus pakistanensis]